jgi:hypothetical protein
LRAAIEAAFARADRLNVRAVTREIEGLIARLSDSRQRARYAGALDALPEMVRHAGGADA